MMTVDQMVTEDQRDAAVQALEQIHRQTGKVVDAVEQTGLSHDELMRLMSGVIGVIRFVAHSTLDDVKKMNDQRL
jgi:hypothetical protein